MGSSKKKLIFLLPYLNVNTTSAERFKSFIVAAEKDDDLETEVITFDYGISRSYFSGLSIDNVDFLYPKNFKTLKVNLNFIQILAFKCLNSGHFKLWRLFQLTHLILFQTDVFYPGQINKQFPDDDKHTCVFVSGSHFSLFSTAKSLSDKLGYKLIIDYRDPWTFGYKAIDGYVLVQKLKVFFGRKKEKQILKQVSLVTTVSSSLKSLFPKEFHHKIQIVSNGSNFSDVEVAPNNYPVKFNLVYAGTVYHEQLKEEVFFSALEKFISDKDASRIKLQFLGANENILRPVIKKYSLQEITEITPRLNKQAFLNYMNNAVAFLHLRYANKTDVISSKIAEYLIFKKPIILPVSDHGDIAKAVGSQQTNFICKDPLEVLETLETLWRRFEKKEPSFTNGGENKSDKSLITRTGIAKMFIEKIKSIL